MTKNTLINITCTGVLTVVLYSFKMLVVTSLATGAVLVGKTWLLCAATSGLIVYLMRLALAMNKYDA